MALSEPPQETLAAFQDFASSPSSLQAALIPEIDLQPLYQQLKHASTAKPRLQSAGYAHLVSALSQAASSLGFFRVFNHDISLSALDTIYSSARKFFSLPLERKHEIGKLLQLPPSGNPSGYLHYNYNEWWSESLRVASSNQDAMHLLAEHLYPLDLNEQHVFCDALKESSCGFAKLAQAITLVLLEGLGLNGKEIKEEDEEIATFNLSYYPPCSLQPNMTLGLPAHTDLTILSILWQDQVGGLEVHMDGEWVMVKPRHDMLIVNIGDVFQIWSNDYYQSCLHRVVLNTSQSRYSMAFFHNRAADPMLYPIPELLERTKESSKFRTTLLSKHRDYVRSDMERLTLEGVNYLRY